MTPCAVPSRGKLSTSVTLISQQKVLVPSPAEFGVVNSKIKKAPALRKLKLLDPKYKEEAFRLFKDRIKSTRFTVNEFSTLAETTRTREFYPRSGNPNPTIIL